MTTPERVRLRWQDLPAAVRARIEEAIGGGPVVEAVTQSGGFSPGTADRVHTADGTRAFVKAVSTTISPSAVVIARRELRYTAALPPGTPVPRVLGGFDDGEWVALVLEDVEGRLPGHPWTPADLDRALAALRDLEAALTPSPVPGVPHLSESYWVEDFDSWRLIAEDPPADLDPWAAANLDRLRAASARGLRAIGTGDTLNHTDLRGDNFLIRPDGTAVVVDWPHAAVGPAWFDRVILAMNVIFSGQDPAPALAGIDPDAVLGVVAGATGAFLHMTRLPPPPATPAVWPFARRQADAWVAWLQERTRWPA